jgi:hypothetical protein
VHFIQSANQRSEPFGIIGNIDEKSELLKPNAQLKPLRPEPELFLAYEKFGYVKYSYEKDFAVESAPNLLK